MATKWKLENNVFYSLSTNSEWIKAMSVDVFKSAFGDKGDNITSFFPEIHFSKFSIAPTLKLFCEKGQIVISTFVTIKGKDYSIPLPKDTEVDYTIIDNSWFYFDGKYDLLNQILSESKIYDNKITFLQYINLLNNLSLYQGLSVIDNVMDCLSKQSDPDDISQPPELKTPLYKYQTVGYKWLKYVTDENCGCILGDEMGLGKTMQIIALFLSRKQYSQAPFLVIAPVSLLENWKREMTKFAPSLKLLVHHGSSRTGRYKDFLNFDVIITSYGSVVSDLSIFEMVNWDLLVIDEAQNIKTPDTTRTITIKQIPRRSAIAVTGTPFENHMTDIWSLLDFAIPNCLGSLSCFQAKYHDDIKSAEDLEPILTAMMLRRKVCDVANDLPEKILISQPLAMDEAEAIAYENKRQEILDEFENSNATLASLTILRMYCTHPFLIGDENAAINNPAKYSTKYARFCEIVEEIVDNHEKVIVFTSYTRMFNIFENDIPYRFDVPVFSINGSTVPNERQSIVDVFSNTIGSAVLILNPRAAGVGLNITSANHVIHYNLEWNPAIEDQATARAFRRGQKKNVFVYRLYYTNTVEEIVNERIENKRSLSDVAVVGSSGQEDVKSEISRALGLSPIIKGRQYE